MEIFYESSPNLLRKSAIALGFFDGVHLGHQTVIAAAIEEAKLKDVTSAIVTFKDHPRALIRGNSPLLLTNIEQRLDIFENLGVQAALVLTFTEELCRLTPQEYVETVLVQSMGARLISVGFNHHFGRQREGNPQLLSEFGKTMGFAVRIATPVYVDGMEVSSSKIRESLENANLDIANKLLSRPFSLPGKVIAGEGRGAKLGFPTANLQTSQFQMLPATGVYAAKVRLSAQANKRIYYDAVVNIGCRPTFAGDINALPITEVHLLNFKGNLYDKNIEVYFYKYLRPEMKFSGPEALKTQINTDCKTASQLFSSLPAV